MKRDYWEIVQAMPAAALADLMHRLEDLGLYGIWSSQLRPGLHTSRWFVPPTECDQTAPHPIC